MVGYIKKLRSLVLEELMMGYVSSRLLVRKDLKALCKKAVRQCQTIDLVTSKIDNHKAMIAAYWCRPSDCIIDVGVNQGNYSLYYSKLVGENGSLVGFEANPYLLSYILDRLKKHNIINTIIHSKAVSRDSGAKIPMKVYTDPTDIRRAISTAEPALMKDQRMPGKTEMIEVETQKLDDLLNVMTQKVRFIKIDVEGHEQAVLEGAKDLLQKYHPVVIFEYGYSPGSFEPQSIAIMENLGYMCYDLQTDQRVYPNFITSLTDIIAVPSENEEEFIEVLPQLYYRRPLIPLFSRNITTLMAKLAMICKKKMQKYFVS